MRTITGTLAGLFLVGVCLPAMIWVGGTLLGDDLGGWAESLTFMGFLPFAESDEFHFFGLMMFTFMGGWQSWQPHIAPDALSSILRHLRALPLSAWRVTLVLAGMRWLTWLVVWIALVVFHFIYVREPMTSLRAPEFFCMASIDLLIKSVQLNWRRAGFPGVLFLVALVAIVIARYSEADQALALMLILGGLTASTAGVWLIHRTITRNRSTYAPPAPKSIPPQFAPPY